MSLVFMVSLLHVSTALITKHALLTPQIPPLNGSFITLNPHSTSIVAGMYYLITVQSQDSYDLKLSLDSSHGFDSLYTSTFSLTIDGFTPFSDKITDILFTFSVGNLQYISFLLHLDKYNRFNKIYFSSNHTQHVSEWISNNNTILNRYNRISSNNQWHTLNNHQSLWPLKFVITNNPTLGYSTFEFYHNIPSTLSVKHKLDGLLFDPNKEIDIYISGNSINEQFYIESFDILLTKNMSTYPPTHKATTPPTPEPTHKPTILPTFSPVHIIYTINNTIETNWSRLLSTETYIKTNELFSDNKIKAYSIVASSMILFGVAVFCIIFLVCRKCYKPIGRKESNEITYDNDNNTDSETNDEYMNEGALAPTGSFNTRAIKHDGFIVGSRASAMIINGIRKFSMNTIVSSDASRKNTSEQSIDSRSISIGNNENINENFNENVNECMIESNENSVRTIGTRTVCSDDTTVIPLHEKENLDKFIQMITDKRNELLNDTTQGYDNDNIRVISRKVSDEMNYCVSFNYCDAMIE